MRANQIGAYVPRTLVSISICFSSRPLTRNSQGVSSNPAISPLDYQGSDAQSASHRFTQTSILNPVIFAKDSHSLKNA
jgi:hypothetical protein